MSKLIKIAHSPDTDDIFMFYALHEGLVRTPHFECEIEAKDIGELNELAKKEIYDITALSFHAYAHLSDRYALLSSGASMAENDYGPLLVSKHKKSLEDFAGKKIAVPGLTTTAFLILKIMLPHFEAIPMPANRILTAIQNNEVDAGLIIHEAQIHYVQSHLKVVGRIIEAWQNIAGDLPLPLGCSAVKKSLGQTVMQELSDLQKQSIQYAFDHRKDALEYARKAAPELSAEEADRYLNWYANARTLDLKEEEIKAIKLLFEKAYQKNIIPNLIDLEIY